MSLRDDERSLWRVGDVECVMVSCCAGAELQVRHVRLKADATYADVEVILRELYPMKSDLYERARDLHSEYLAKTDGSSRSHEERKEHGLRSS
jgi:hypothetical protein